MWKTQIWRGLTVLILFESTKYPALGRKEGRGLSPFTEREAAAQREVFCVGSAGSGLESRSVSSPTPSSLHSKRKMYGVTGEQTGNF